MTHNASMGLIDKFFGSGKEKVRETIPQPSTQFHESEPDSEDGQGGRNAPKRELVQVVLRDVMRRHGIPSDWIDCRILSSVSRSGKRGLHVNFVVRRAHEQLLPYVFPFQGSFEGEMERFEPRCREWLLSVGWEFIGVNADEMPDANSWSAGRVGAASVAAAAVPATADAAPRTDDDIQRDLQALFAIRDAALADAARKPAEDMRHPDFEPTQPFDDGDTPHR